MPTLFLNPRPRGAVAVLLLNMLRNETADVAVVFADLNLTQLVVLLRRICHTVPYHCCPQHQKHWDPIAKTHLKSTYLISQIQMLRRFEV